MLEWSNGGKRVSSRYPFWSRPLLRGWSEPRPPGGGLPGFARTFLKIHSFYCDRSLPSGNCAADNGFDFRNLILRVSRRIVEAGLAVLIGLGPFASLIRLT
jgi:hypothetical protein